MSSNQAAEKIKSFILEKIQVHLNAPSQWQTDQELNKDTKDYRIIVKHRFDPNITEMDGVEVFPFAPSKKLYYVDVNQSYVKASCGGVELQDAWDGKLDMEWKRLVHTDTTLPHEILKYQCQDEYHFDSGSQTCVQNKPISHLQFIVGASYVRCTDTDGIAPYCNADADFWTYHRISGYNFDTSSNIKDGVVDGIYYWHTYYKDVPANNALDEEVAIYNGVIGSFESWLSSKYVSWTSRTDTHWMPPDYLEASVVVHIYGAISR
ncbi:MAG: hypothetical protein IE887_05720 [Campylobacterales bacterium]|nr:hypothetical protein [Campylobacterales bacterium]